MAHNPKKGRPKKRRKLRVVWETVPDPDPEALAKAVAMIFSAPPYSNSKLPSGPDLDGGSGHPGKQLELPFKAVDGPTE